VAEPLAGMLREGPAGDQLKGWPATMRVFARRERPHPGAQLSLFEAAGGWRYSLRVTNLPAATRGRRGQCADIGAAHRVHARVQDVIRTGKNTGPGHFPSHDHGLNKAWLDAAMIACILLSWLKLPALDGDLARAEPKTLRYRVLHAGARLVRGGRRRTLKSLPPGPGQGKSSPPGSASRPSRTPPEQHKPVPMSKEGNSWDPWNPRPPGPTAGPPSYPGPKIQVQKPATTPASASHHPP
jgi:DDE family transposase